MATHDVTNQSRPLVDYDVFGADPALTEALQREGAGWAGPDLERIGNAGNVEKYRSAVPLRKEFPP